MALTVSCMQLVSHRDNPIAALPKFPSRAHHASPP
jgi:hypothetical protein